MESFQYLSKINFKQLKYQEMHSFLKFYLLYFYQFVKIYKEVINDLILPENTSDISKLILEILYQFFQVNFLDNIMIILITKLLIVISFHL